MAQSDVIIQVKTKGQRELEKFHQSLVGAESATGKLQRALSTKLNSALQRAGALGIAAGQKIKQGLTTAANSADKLTSKLKGVRGLLVSVGAGAALGKAFSDATALESAETRIKNLTKSYSKFEGIQESANRSAEKFRLTQAEASATYADLGSRLGGTGVELKDLENIYEGFNTLLITNKVEAQQAAAAQLQLGQALGEGVLRAEEYNSLIAATPQLLDEVARVMGVSRGELKKLAGEGKISSGFLIKALSNIRTQGAADLEAAFSGAFGASKEFNKALKEFSTTIGTELLPAITPLLKGATELLKLFGKLPGPVKTVTAAVAGLTAAFVVVAPAISAVAGGLAAFAPAAVAAGGGAQVLAGGLVLLKGAMLALPWVAVAAGVTALVVAMFDGTRKAQEFQNMLTDTGGTSTQLLGKMQTLRGKMEELSEEIERGGRRGRVAKKKYDELKVALENLQGTYKIRLEIEEVFKGTNLGAIKSSGYGRNENGLTYTVAGVTYDAKTGRPVAPPQPLETPSPTGSLDGKTGSGVDRAAEEAKQRAERIAALGRQLQLEQQLTALQADQLKAQLAGDEKAIASLAGEEQLVRLRGELRDIEATISDEREIEANRAVIEERRTQARLKTHYELLQIEKDRKEALEDALQPVQDDIALLQAKLEGKEEEYKLQKAINDLVNQGVPQGQATALVEQRSELEKQLAKLEETKAMWQSLANTIEGEIGSAMNNAITGLVDGTRTAEEAFIDMFRNIGNAFIEMATQMIAKALMMKALGILGGGAGASAGGLGGTGLSGSSNVPFSGSMGWSSWAGGGYTGNGARAGGMDGQGGFPALLHPGETVVDHRQGNSGMSEAMRRYNSANGARNAAAGGEGEGGGSGGGGASPITLNVTATRIADDNWVKVDDMKAALAHTRVESIKAGSDLGMAKALGKLKNSPGVRRGLGL